MCVYLSVFPPFPLLLVLCNIVQVLQKVCFWFFALPLCLDVFSFCWASVCVCVCACVLVCGFMIPGFPLMWKTEAILFATHAPFHWTISSVFFHLNRPNQWPKCCSPSLSLPLHCSVSVCDLCELFALNNINSRFPLSYVDRIALESNGNRIN